MNFPALFASQGVAGQQGSKNSKKVALAFLQKKNKKQAKLKTSSSKGPGRARKKEEASKKESRQEEKQKAKQQKKSKTKNESLSKKRNKSKQKKSGKRKGGLRGSPSPRAYTCNGTSLGDTCLTNLLNSLKFEKDKIRTFTNQKKRAESFKKIVGNKGGKDDQFGNTTTYLLMALGGNMTNLNCSGKTSLTTEAAATYT